MGILDFYRSVPYLWIKQNKKFTKNPSNFYLLKVKKFHGDSVKNKSSRAKKTRGGGAQYAVPSSLFRIKSGIAIFT